MGKFKTWWISFRFQWGKSKTGQIQSCMQYSKIVKYDTQSSEFGSKQAYRCKDWIYLWKWPKFHITANCKIPKANFLTNYCIENMIFHKQFHISIPYKRKFSRVSNFAILWSKVVSLFSRVQFFTNLKIHKMLGEMTYQGCIGSRQSDPCIPVILVLIDLPYILVPRLINFLWKNHFNSSSV